MAEFEIAVSKTLAHEGGYSKVSAVLLRELKTACAIESRKGYKPPVPKDHRGRPCGVENCPNLECARGLCNAHYIRQLEGRSLETPLRNRKRCAVCSDCSNKTDGKGAWGRCSRCISRYRSRVLKLALLSTMGNVCQSCSQSFPPCVFDFHHLAKKNDSISSLLQNGSLKRIAAEASKCELLCANCHRMKTNGRP